MILTTQHISVKSVNSLTPSDKNTKQHSILFTNHANIICPTPGFESALAFKPDTHPPRCKCKAHLHKNR